MKAQRRSQANVDSQPETPIQIKPFDPHAKQRALVYLAQLNQLMAQFGVPAELFGSVELEIATKGEWEFALYPNDDHWFPVLVCLINHFGSIHFLSDDMAVFTTIYDGTDVEVIPMRGDASRRNQAIMDYWRTNPAALLEYEQGKLEHAYSKREYYRWKDEHIARIVESL